MYTVPASVRGRRLRNVSLVPHVPFEREVNMKSYLLLTQKRSDGVKPTQ